MRSPSVDDIYSPSFVRGLFDEMSRTYGTVNVISSFGFCVLWRKQCISQIPITSDMNVVDLMTGMGELCPNLARRIGPGGSIVAVDLSPNMCELARNKVPRHLSKQIQIIEGDALELSLPDQSADAVVSSFGLKTFSQPQVEILARQVARVLRPGGVFAFLEISMPRVAALRIPYMFYLNRVIPMIGSLFMGNPDNYRMLGVYTSRFENCSFARDAFINAGLTCESTSFFGCATGIRGRKAQ